MTIEIIGKLENGRVLVTMEAAELDGYGVTFSAMSLGDPSTRVLLSDLIAMVTRMGLRGEGEPVRIDCARAEHGRCVLLISRTEENAYYFESSDDVISAHLAQALPEGRLSRDEHGWRFEPSASLSEGEERLLLEFCLPRGQAQ